MAKKIVLPNGITCACEERPGSGFVTMQVYMNSGSAHEAPEENGLTNLMQEASFGGTATRTRAEIASAAEAKGGALGGETSRFTTDFRAFALTGDEEAAFALLADVVRNPTFTPEEVEHTKASILQGLAAQDQDPQSKAAANYMETAFSGYAMGRDPSGTADLVASFTPEQVRKKHDELMANPSGMVISFTGDITAAQAEKLTRKYFGDVPSASPRPAVTASFTGGDTRIPAEIDQLKLFTGFPAPSMKSEDRFAAMMLQNLLAGGMSTPIFQEFREKRGLVYTATAQFVATSAGGTFFIASGSGAGKAGDIVKVTFDILGKAAREGFGRKELDEARERIMRGWDESREKAMNVSGINAAQIIEKGRFTSREEFEARLKAVTSDDIRRVCADMLQSGKYALSAVGPLDTLPPPAEIKEMMGKAVEGVVVPPAPKAAAVKAEFAAAAAATVKPPQAPPKITVLDNGLTIVTVERPGPLSCGAWVGVGSDNETPHLNGATHMNEHMMFKGTPDFKPGEIDRLVEGELGGQLNAYTTKDKTCYYFFNLAPAALDKIVHICGQMVFYANIREEDYSGAPGSDSGGEREAVFEEMRMNNNELSRRMINALEAVAYPGQPHGRTIIGTEEGLNAITSAELRAYRDDFYTPNNVIFCAAGPVKHEDFVAAVKAEYGHLKPGSVPNLPKPVWHGGAAVDEAPNARVCNVAIGMEGAGTADAESDAYSAVGVLLGDGVSSILHREIVDRLELAPGVEAGSLAYRNGGTFLIDAMTQAENVKPMMNAVYKALRGFAENVGEADLAKAKAMLEAQLRTNLETNGNASNAFACDVQANGRLVTPEEQYGNIRKLTVDDLKRVAKKLLDCNPAASMVVPPGTDRSLLPTHDEVVAMRDGKWKPSVPAPKASGPSAP